MRLRAAALASVLAAQQPLAHDVRVRGHKPDTDIAKPDTTSQNRTPTSQNLSGSPLDVRFVSAPLSTPSINFPERSPGFPNHRKTSQNASQTSHHKTQPSMLCPAIAVASGHNASARKASQRVLAASSNAAETSQRRRRRSPLRHPTTTFRLFTRRHIPAPPKSTASDALYRTKTTSRDVSPSPFHAPKPTSGSSRPGRTAWPKPTKRPASHPGLYAAVRSRYASVLAAQQPLAISITCSEKSAGANAPAHLR